MCALDGAFSMGFGAFCVGVGIIDSRLVFGKGEIEACILDAG